jgi:zinc/manganese transport system permease protein
MQLLAAGTGLLDVLAHPFMRHALLAGTGIAAACGLVGSFLVLRSQVFSGDALSHVAFTGALAALAAGLDVRVGLFAASIAVAVVMGVLGSRGRADDVVIGVVFTWVLGLGVLFATIYTTSRGTGNSTAGVNVLFGSIFGLSGSEAVLAALVGVAVCAVMLVIARPLLFATLDETVARARGVPVRTLGIAFLVLVGVCAAEASQAVGALLLVGLIAAPAGAARRLTDRPYRAMLLSTALAVLAVWVGLLIAYLAPDVPPSFAIMAVAAAVYAGAFAVSPLRRRRRERSADQAVATYSAMSTAGSTRSQ